MFHREPIERRAARAALAGVAVLLMALVSASCGAAASLSPTSLLRSSQRDEPGQP
jgi:hypothetical protein